MVIENLPPNFAGRAIQATRKDGSVVQVAPVQVQGLYQPEQTINPLSAPVAFRLGAAEASYVDGKGNVVNKTLDRAGQTVSSSDGIGALPSVQRNEQNLVTSSTNCRGQKTLFTYDTQGNLLTSQDELSSTSQFIDISQIGQPVPGLQGQDDSSVLINLPFAFTFYDQTYTQAGISTNGILTFGGTNSTFSNQSLNSASLGLPFHTGTRYTRQMPTRSPVASDRSLSLQFRNWGFNLPGYLDRGNQRHPVQLPGRTL